ncbi:glycosyltransferase family 2 protein [Pedobacter foliorum]|uniref:glycosyltransferase n=1 Tax=Pedobacter foliorum TaxID=2739058 RepID=UPI0015640A1A|nr:glycosyltransferase family 2 protein [Pedobacter foliorum]NRF39487.1 glycosyltransferase [Pedobacter foliorum]
MLFYYLLAVLVFWVALAILLLMNAKKIRFLRDQPLAKVSPTVAVVIAVRNEEDNLAEALKSVCSLDYPNYRVMVVNDRSTDQTQTILESFTGQYPHLSVSVVSELPPGWLGKNHALQQGYLCTDSEWLLFTDADIVFDKAVLSRSMHYVTEHSLDHLTIFPEVKSRSLFLRSILQTFFIMLELRQKPWDARNPNSDAHMGIGAFNLVKRSSYQHAGTHSRIRLRPDDDLQLGRLIKSSGFSQDVLYGEDQIGLEWYTSVGEFIDGLMKNMFSVFDYNPFKALGTAISTFLVFTLPLPAALLSGNRWCILFGLAILVLQWLVMWFKPTRKQWWDFLTIAFAGAVMTYIVLKSTYKTLSQNGIVWRDSFYSLKELKKRSD